MEKFNKITKDGIDVSKCSNYDSEQYFECEISSCHCEEINNCYFKQLARATREIENIISKAKEEIENLRNLQDDLVARNEELQNKLNEIGKLLKDALDIEKTNTDESFENFYKCLDIIKKIKEVE